MLQTATKADLWQRIDDERGWWDSLVARATPEQMESIRISDDWAVRDLVAHLLSWWEWRLTRLNAAVNNEPKPNPPFPAGLESIDDKNAWFHQDKLNRSAHELTTTFSESFERLKGIVSNLPDEELADPARIPFLEGHALGPSIADGSFFEHVHEQHARDIQTWKARTQSA